MKKILLAGALAASMLASSAAFAADLTVGVSEDKLTVTADTDAIMTANAGKQMTVVVVDGNGSTVSTDTIRYIDQDEAKAGLFESMGVLLKDGETALPVGTYTVKIGGEDITDLYVGTLTIAAEVTGTKVTFVWGDVNAEDGLNVTDAMDIISAQAGGSATVGSSAYAIGSVLTTVDGAEIVWGDVNAEDGLNVTDAMDIISAQAGGSATVGSSAYAIGSEVTVTLK
jgi:hypothetical protein